MTRPSLLLLALAGCTTTSTYEDIASLCLTEGFGSEDEPADVDMEAFEPFALVQYSCTTLVDLTCDVEQVGDELVFRTVSTFEEKTRFRCDMMLNWATAPCVLPEPVEAGAFTLVGGGSEMDVDLPGTVPQRCLRP